MGSAAAVASLWIPGVLFLDFRLVVPGITSWAAGLVFGLCSS